MTLVRGQQLPPFPALTRGDRLVLTDLALGRSRAETAQTYNLRPWVIGNVRTRLLRLTGCRTGMQLIDVACRSQELMGLNAGPAPDPRHPITEMQWTVYGCLVTGLTMPQAAEKLGLSLETVKSHNSRLMRRLGARNRPHAVALIHQHNLLPQGLI
jgi:DNA-binding NarL/FixJ family response regulator